MDPNKLNGYCRFMFDGLTCCEQKLDDFSGLCHNHKTCVITPTIENSYIVHTIKSKMTKLDQTCGKSKKIMVANEIFTLLCKHKQFVFVHKKFQDTILKKLLEFGKVFDTTKFLEELFPLTYLEQDTSFEICI